MHNFRDSYPWSQVLIDFDAFGVNFRAFGKEIRNSKEINSDVEVSENFDRKKKIFKKVIELNDKGTKTFLRKIESSLRILTDTLGGIFRKFGVEMS